MLIPLRIILFATHFSKLLEFEFGNVSNLKFGQRVGTYIYAGRAPVSRVGRSSGSDYIGTCEFKYHRSEDSFSVQQPRKAELS